MQNCKHNLNYAVRWQTFKTFLIVVVFVFTNVSLVQANTEDFDAQMLLAGNAEGRTARVAHLKRAMELRPNHPENIVLEYRIGIALSQHGDPENNTSPNPVEAIPWFKGILDRYQQDDYYERESPGRIWEAQLLIPKSAVQLATVLAVTEQGNPQEIRDGLLTGMDALELTYRKRRKDWLEATEPMTVEQTIATHGEMLIVGPGLESKIKYRREAWRTRRKAAELGEVFNDREMRMVRASVGHYGASYGLQRPWEVKQAMQELIDRYPDTPIAAAAQDHIERASQMVKQQMEKQLAQLPNELFDNAPVDSQTIETTTPPVEVSNDAPKPLKDSPLTSPAATTLTDAPWLPSAAIAAILIVCLASSCVAYLHRRRR